MTSNLPSCIKSFILPIAYNAAMIPDTVAYLGSLQVDLASLLTKWIDYTPKFSSEAATISYQGLLAIFKATVSDL